MKSRSEKLIDCVLGALALIFLLALFAPRSNAQSLKADAAVGWTLPTTGCVGSTCNLPLTGPDALSRIELYASTSPIPDAGATPFATLPANAVSYAYSASVPNGSTLYFRVASCSALVCSRLSQQGTKAVRVVVPSEATGVSVTVTVTLTTTTP